MGYDVTNGTPGKPDWRARGYLCVYKWTFNGAAEVEISRIDPRSDQFEPEKACVLVKYWCLDDVGSIFNELVKKTDITVGGDSSMTAEKAISIISSFLSDRRLVDGSGQTPLDHKDNDFYRKRDDTFAAYELDVQSAANELSVAVEEIFQPWISLVTEIRAWIPAVPSYWFKKSPEIHDLIVQADGHDDFVRMISKAFSLHRQGRKFLLQYDKNHSYYGIAETYTRKGSALCSEAVDCWSISGRKDIDELIRQVFMNNKSLNWPFCSTSGIVSRDQANSEVEIVLELILNFRAFDIKSWRYVNEIKIKDLLRVDSILKSTLLTFVQSNPPPEYFEFGY